MGHVSLMIRMSESVVNHVSQFGHSFTVRLPAAHQSSHAVRVSRGVASLRWFVKQGVFARSRAVARVRGPRRPGTVCRSHPCRVRERGHLPHMEAGKCLRGALAGTRSERRVATPRQVRACSCGLVARRATWAKGGHD